MKMKTIPILIMFLLVVHITLAFAQQPVTITIVKELIEADLAGFNLYQDGNAEPFATMDAAVTPWTWQGVITLINGQASITATAFDTSGNESGHSPAAIYDPPPGVPDQLIITIIVTGT